MFSKSEIKSFVSGILSDKSKDVLPYWQETSKIIQPLREVVVIKDNKKVTNKKNSIFYVQPATIEIRVISSSSYSTNY